MDLSTLIISVFSGGLIASVVTEILKNPVVPIAFEKFPRITAYVLSVLASILVLVNQGITWATVTANWISALSIGAVAFIVSVIAYEKVVKKDSGKGATRF